MLTVNHFFLMTNSDKIWEFINSIRTMDIIIWGAFVGILVGAVASTMEKWYAGKYIKALLERQASCPENAVTLLALDISGKWYLKGALRPGKPLRKMLLSPENAPAADSTWNVPLYLPEENRIKAQIRYDNGKHPIRMLIISLVLLVGAALFALFAVPELITMLNNFIGSL